MWRDGRHNDVGIQVNLCWPSHWTANTAHYHRTCCEKSITYTRRLSHIQITTRNDDLCTISRYRRHAGTSNYIPQYLWAVVTCPCPPYFLLAHKSTNMHLVCCIYVTHDDVTKWKHFLRNWPFCDGKTTGQLWTPQRPVTRSFDIFFDVPLNKRLSKQSKPRWFETSSCSLSILGEIIWFMFYWNYSKLLRRHIGDHETISIGAHDDVIKWKHFPRYWPFVRGIHRSPMNSPHKGQWRGALMFALICVWINGWVNNREAGDLRRHRAHYDVIVMKGSHTDESCG